MTLFDIFVQALGLIPSVIAFTSLQSGNRKRILILQFFCSIMWGVHYGILGAFTAVATNLIGIFRAVICYYNDRPWAKSKWLLALLIVLYAAGAAFTWEGPHSLLPTFSMMLTTFALWSHDMRLTRLLFLLNSPSLLAYNLITGSYSCAIIEAMALCSFALAVYRFDIRKKSPTAPR